MRIDDRDRKKKPCLTAPEVLLVLKKLKPFPVSVLKGWKLHSFRHNSRVWFQEVSVNSNSSELNVFAAYTKTGVQAQLILHILKDVSKTPHWKPGCLATSIISRPAEIDVDSKLKGVMGDLPVQHDIVMEESSPNFGRRKGLWKKLSGQVASLQTIKKELTRYWHRENNGVCWHLQMCEREQEWIFFLMQPVDDVEECLVTVLCYRGQHEDFSTVSYVSEVISSLTEYIHYRKILATPFVDLKLPTSHSERLMGYDSSSEEQAGAGRRMLRRFRSFVENPLSSGKISVKQQLIRSSNILKHKGSTYSNGIGTKPTDLLRTNSLDRRRNMPSLKTSKCANDKENDHVQKPDRSNESPETSQLTGSESNKHSSKNDHDKEGAEAEKKEDGNWKDEGDKKDPEKPVSSLEEKEQVEDIDRTLDADVTAQQEYEASEQALLKSANSKEGIKHMVIANQTAADLLAVALQASNIDLSKSIQDQVINSGGWMFCGLDNDVVVLKKVSIKETLHCYLGKGMIQADPRIVWNAIKNPRMKFTYDDSLKKVDVVENVSETIKIVYYYHEVLQLFKTECCDIVVTQSERVHSGEKYILAYQSANGADVQVQKGTVRLKVLPSGWIIEPVTKDKKLFAMVTYIMQIDLGDLPLGVDRTPFEDLVSKQPMSIAYLRQYLKGCSFPR